MTRLAAALALAVLAVAAPVTALALQATPTASSRTVASPPVSPAEEPGADGPVPELPARGRPSTTSRTPASSPAAAPVPASSSFMQPELRLLLGAAVLGLLLWGASRLLRRLPIARLLPSAQGPIRVVARTHLGAKESLCLIHVGSTSILLAITPTAIHTVHVWPDAAPAGVPAPPGEAPAVPGQLRNLQSWLAAARR